MNQATIRIVTTSTATIIEATNAIATTDDPTIVIETNDAMIVLSATIRTTRAVSPMRKKMIASTITPRKRMTRPCSMTSPLHQTWTPRPEKGVILAQYLLNALVLGFALT